MWTELSRRVVVDSEAIGRTDLLQIGSVENGKQ
jgi:hypothetical protein